VPELRGREAGTVLARLRRADDRGSLTTEGRPCDELHRAEIVVLRLSNQATIVQFAWFT